MLAHYRASYRPDWMLGAFVHGRKVAQLAVLPWRMAINGSTVPLGAIADVGAWPEDRRAGHTGELLRACLGRMREQGLALSMLYPTFFALYQRFGWGLASEERSYSFRAADLRLLPAVETDGGRAERLTPEHWRTLAAVYDRLLADANGAVVRDEAYWSGRRLHTRTGPPVQVILWRDAAGAPQGYLLHNYPSRAAGPGDGYQQQIGVRELVAATPAAYRGLLGYLARHDLAGRLSWTAPPDDPLPSLLADPAAVHTETRPGFMLRVVDLAAALAARGCLPGPAAQLTLRVGDRAAPWNEGTWLLAAEDGRMSVTATAREPELSVEAGTLAALYNGFISPQQAAYAGLLQVHDRTALAAAARLFAVSRPPFMHQQF